MSSARRKSLAASCCQARNSRFRSESSDISQCGVCEKTTCAPHAYIGPNNDWHCSHCFATLSNKPTASVGRFGGGLELLRPIAAHMQIVVHALHICGVCRHALELLRYCRTRNVYTTVVAVGGGGHWADRFLALSNELHIAYGPSWARDAMTMTQWRSNRRIISCHYDPAINCALANVDEGAEIYAHFHTAPEYGLFTQITLHEAGAKSRRVFFPSEQTRSQYAALLRHDQDWFESKTQVLPNAYPITTGLVGMDGRGARDTESRLAIVSRLDADKISLDFFIQTIDQLRNRVPNLKVRVAGDGLLGGLARERVATAGLGSYVEMLGWVEDVSPLYHWADATFLPSWTETMPYAAIESVCAGRPVVIPALGHFSSAAGGSEDLVYALPKIDPGLAVGVLASLLRRHTSRPQASSSDQAFSHEQWKQKVDQVYGLREIRNDNERRIGRI